MSLPKFKCSDTQETETNSSDAIFGYWVVCVVNNYVVGSQLSSRDLSVLFVWYNIENFGLKYFQKLRTTVKIMYNIV